MIPTRMEAFRALKLSSLENFRALIASNLANSLYCPKILQSGNRNYISLLQKELTEIWDGLNILDVEQPHKKYSARHLHKTVYYSFKLNVFDENLNFQMKNACFLHQNVSEFEC